MLPNGLCEFSIFPISLAHHDQIELYGLLFLSHFFHWFYWYSHFWYACWSPYISCIFSVHFLFVYFVSVWAWIFMCYGLLDYSFIWLLSFMIAIVLDPSFYTYFWDWDWFDLYICLFVCINVRVLQAFYCCLHI